MPRAQSDTGAGLAFMFPGQGAQDSRMLDGVRSLPEFARHHQLVCDLMGTDLVRELARGDSDFLRQNKVSSILTVLVGALRLAEWRRLGGEEPACVAGYSVGQWTALHAAGALDFATLAKVVLARAEWMDSCVHTKPSGMYAVLGLPDEAVEEILLDLREQGHEVYVSNLNCLGNLTIAGTLAALEVAALRLAALNPKKLLRLPVSGAWHCPILEQAETRFGAWLAGIKLEPAKVPVLDNVTGGWLPAEPAQRLRSLARHLTSPVQWHRGVRHCIASGCDRFVELGHGGSLVKLGFFIDRRSRFESFGAVGAMPSPRAGDTIPASGPSRCAG